MAFLHATHASAQDESVRAEDPIEGLAGLWKRLEETRRYSVALTQGLTPEDQTIQSMPDASPTKWHLAHTTWFFETFLLVPHAPGYQVFHPDFAYLFNSYYEGAGARHPRAERGLLSRPTVTEVLNYRAHVDAALGRWLGGGDVAESARIAFLLELGLNHEQQHQELLVTDIKHMLARLPRMPEIAGPLGAESPVSAAHEAGWILVPEGLYRIGHDGAGFAFDNEGPAHKVWLDRFAIADRPVTCGDYLAFMADGGYERAEFWLSDGWATVQVQGWHAPLYWHREGDDWHVRTLAGDRPVDPGAPVCHVSLYEADAFAKWADSRLPTEAEWEIALGGKYSQTKGLGLHPALTGTPPYVGQAWEWTASAYTAYPGFRAPEGVIGEYNGKFMSGQMVLRGASCATPPGHGRATYRNFFPAATRWQFSGFRLARAS